MSNAELYTQRLAEKLNITIAEARRLVVEETYQLCKGRYSEARR